MSATPRSPGVWGASSWLRFVAFVALVTGSVCCQGVRQAHAGGPSGRKGRGLATQGPQTLPADLLHLQVPTPTDPVIASAIAPLVDPGGLALRRFNEAMANAKAKRGQVRVAFWGASHTAADLWSGHVRRLLQARLGDAGHGYVMPVRWHIGTRHQDLNISASKGWKVWRHRLRTPVSVGDYGYNGVAVSSADPEQWMEIKTTTTNEMGRRASVFELWFRRSTKAGDVIVEIDGKAHTVPTSGPAGPDERRWRLPDGPHHLRIRPAGNGEVYLYGGVLERQTPGAIVDQMGIPGMRGAIQLRWLESTWRRHVKRRSPDLVVLAYGTNAVGDKHQPLRVFRERWRDVLSRLRRAAPRASCVIVGPTDRPARRDRRGHRKLRPHQAKVITAQLQIAREYGCAYWDAVQAMGGPRSMLRWVKAKLGTRDYVHLTRAGYEWLAERFVIELLKTSGTHQADPSRSSNQPR